MKGVLVRYTVTVPSSEAYEQAAKLLRAGVVVHHRDEKRLYFSISEPPTALLQKLRKLDAIISLDTQHDLE